MVGESLNILVNVLPVSEYPCADIKNEVEEVPEPVKVRPLTEL